MACALLHLLGVSSIKLIGSVDYIAAVYALTIVSFMAGVHWGIALDPQRTAWPVNLFLSNRNCRNSLILPMIAAMLPAS